MKMMRMKPKAGREMIETEMGVQARKVIEMGLERGVVLKTREVGPKIIFAIMQTMGQGAIHLRQEVEGKCHIARNLESICTLVTTSCYL